MHDNRKKELCIDTVKQLRGKYERLGTILHSDRAASIELPSSRSNRQKRLRLIIAHQRLGTVKNSKCHLAVLILDLIHTALQQPFTTKIIRRKIGGNMDCPRYIRNDLPQTLRLLTQVISGCSRIHSE